MGEGRVPGPLGAGGTVVRTPAPLGARPARTLGDFKREVIERQIKYLRTTKGRSFIPAVPSSELEIIEGKHSMRRVAAGKCRELLAAARADLADGKKAGDAAAKATTSIVIHSAYRSFAEDSAAWEGTFREHYQKLLDERLFPGEELGTRALQHILKIMIAFKAPPGFSNHSNGLAVDFGTTFRGHYLGAKSKLRPKWRATWLHPWLKENAASHGFKPLSTEEWHWDFA